ncbi:MAG: hypothetical protein N2109_06080 [Fimbriimonadales bacterium]|nr:hypothetical protein [Fimbriimonadales bacterium]
MAQFIVELVGPRPAPGVWAREALQHPWFGALGEPEVYCMDAGDRFWRTMTVRDAAASYDSLALAWRYLDRRGRLTGRSAERLYHTAERFASRLERVAMPLLPPEHVDAHVRLLEELRERLDVMIALTVRPTSGWFEPASVARVLETLGYRESPTGWGLFVGAWPEALVEAAADYDPSEGPSKILAIDLGLRVSRNPDPLWSLDRMHETVSTLATHRNCLAVDDDGQLVDAARMEWIRRQAAEVVRELKDRGLPAGSPEALMVFPD